jgi:hypothetical protein
MYDASLPVFIRMLGNMSSHLEKAEAFATTKKFDAANFVQLRLAPDMLPFARQVQIACDTAKLCASRLAGIEAPKHEDNEKTLPELRERIASTIAFLKTVSADKLTGSEDRTVNFKQRGEPVALQGNAYLTGYALPNFYFHYTTAYALLRHGGVELGKTDYLKGVLG